MKKTFLTLLLLAILELASAPAATVVFEFKALVTSGGWQLSSDLNPVSLNGATLTITGTTISDVDSGPGNDYGVFQTQLSFAVSGLGTLDADAGDFQLLQIQIGSQATTGFERTVGSGSLIFDDPSLVYFTNPSLLETVGTVRFNSMNFSGFVYGNDAGEFI